MARVLLSWWRFLPVAARSEHSKYSTFMSHTPARRRVLLQKRLDIEWRSYMAWRAALFLAATVWARAAAATPTYVGAAACAKCHADVSHRWSQSRHSKM